MRLLSGVALALAATVTVVSAQEGGDRDRLAQDIHALHDMATGRMAYDRQRALQFSESLRRLASRPDGWRFHKLPDLERSEVAAWRAEIARFAAAATEGQEALQQVARSGGDGCRSCHVTEKTASPQDFGVGDTITYTYVIRNEGTQPIDGPVIGIVNGQEVYGPIGVDVQDDKIPATSIQCQPDPAPSVLPPGGEFICTAQYTATQADVNAGSITNIANGRINDGDSTEEGTATVTARPGGRKTVSIVKNADRSNFSAGDVVTYSFTVTNTGDLPLQAPLTIDDDRIGPVACAVPGGLLAVGASVTCTAQYAVTPDDLLYPALVNRATAQIEDAGSNLAAVQIDNESDISLRKFAQPATFSAGDTITYVYQVWNTSGATMPTPFTLTVDDDRIATVNCPPNPTPWYSPGVRMCFASHVATAADVAAGEITNTATATVSTGGITMTSPPATATVTAQRLELVKQPDQPWFQDGEAISWTFTVTNATGQTVPGPITISDTLLGPVTCGPGPLAPGASTICTSSYQTTAADAANGEVVNTASVAAGALSSLPVSAVTPHAGLSLEKTGSPQEFWQGDVITYTYRVTNTGSAALPGPVTVSDNRLGAVACPPVASLAPGASVDCTATYTAKAADAEIGRIDNTATASAGGGAVVSDPAMETVYARRLVLEKVADRDFYMPGETITYTYRIRNAGTSPILWNTAQVSDDRIPAVLCPSLAGGGQAVLQPGQSVTCSGLYQTTIADLPRGCIVNRATALLGGQATNVATAEVCPRVDRLPPDVIGSPAVSDIRPVGRPAPPVVDSGAAQPLPSSGLRDAAIPALLGLGTGAMLLFLDNDGDAAASTTGTR